jgi:hypothetical protein
MGEKRRDRGLPPESQNLPFSRLWRATVPARPQTHFPLRQQKAQRLDLYHGELKKNFQLRSPMLLMSGCLILFCNFVVTIVVSNALPDAEL